MGWGCYGNEKGRQCLKSFMKMLAEVIPAYMYQATAGRQIGPGRPVGRKGAKPAESTLRVSTKLPPKRRLAYMRTWMPQKAALRHKRATTNTAVPTRRRDLRVVRFCAAKPAGVCGLNDRIMRWLVHWMPCGPRESLSLAGGVWQAVSNGKMFLKLHNDWEMGAGGASVGNINTVKHNFHEMRHSPRTPGGGPATPCRRPFSTSFG